MDARVRHQPDRPYELQLQPADVAVRVVLIHAELCRQLLGVQRPPFDEGVVVGEAAHHRQLELLGQSDLEVVPRHGLVVGNGRHEVPRDRVAGDPGMEGAGARPVSRPRDVEPAATELFGNHFDLCCGCQVEDGLRGGAGIGDQTLVLGDDIGDSGLASPVEEPALLLGPGA